MNLIVRYSIKGSPDSAALVAGAVAPLGVAGVNFKGVNVAVGTMAMSDVVLAAQPVEVGVIVPSYSGISDSTYVDKIISIEIPTLTAAGAGGTITYLSIKQSNLGVNSQIIGVETLGFTREEQSGQNPVAAYLGATSLSAYIEYSVSIDRLIIKMTEELLNFSGATLHLRITYKN